MDTVPLSGWGDIHRWPNYRKGKEGPFPAQGGINTAVVPYYPPIAFGDETHLATLGASKYSSSSTEAEPTFGISGNGGDINTSSYKCPVVGGKETVNIAPPQVRLGEMEDQAMMKMMMESHQESSTDSSFIHANSSCVDDSIDISPEDWLQVAKDELSPISS